MEPLRIVLLGGTGFVGQAVVRQLKKNKSEPVEVRAMTRTEKNRLQAPFATSIVGALPAVPSDLFPKEPYVVVHFGLKQIDKDGSGFHKTNIEGTRALAGALTPSCVGIVFGSSVGVYGRGAQTGNDEDQIATPETPLARSLVEAERVLFDAGIRLGIDVYSLRPRFVLGEGDRFILPGMIKMFQQGLMVGRGDEAYTIIDVDDYAEIIIKLVEDIFKFRNREGKVQIPLNVGYQQAITQWEIKQIVERHMALPATRFKVPIMPMFLRYIRRMPFSAVQSLISKLLLIGVEHRVSVERLGSKIGFDILMKSPLEIVDKAICIQTAGDEKHET